MSNSSIGQLLHSSFVFKCTVHISILLPFHPFPPLRIAFLHKRPSNPHFTTSPKHPHLPFPPSTTCQGFRHIPPPLYPSIPHTSLSSSPLSIHYLPLLHPSIHPSTTSLSSTPPNPRIHISLPPVFLHYSYTYLLSDLL